MYWKEREGQSRAVEDSLRFIFGALGCWVCACTCNLAFLLPPFAGGNTDGFKIFVFTDNILMTRLTSVIRLKCMRPFLVEKGGATSKHN